MQIFINNQLAAVKSGTSIEYVSENRLFGGGEDYTFAITLPIAGCPRNQAIFGYLCRTDVVQDKIRYDCEIRCHNFVKFGTATITEITEQDIKLQFLAGRSEQNFDDTFDKVYINELDLGAPFTTDKTAITPANAWNPDHTGCKCVALPWVNDYSGNIQNKANNVVDDAAQKKTHFEWDKDTSGLSWQPYLLHITKKICEALTDGGYSYDFSQWEAVPEYRYLLICNTLPHAWYMPDFAYALPHWTVEEYFEKLELFLGGEFDIDHRARRITFAFTKNVLAAKRPVRLENVVEEHTTEVKADDDRCDYLDSKNLVYKDCDHEMWKFYSCDWFIKGWHNRVVIYNTMRELLEANKEFRTWKGQRRRDSRMDKLLYAADCDAYFVIRPVSRELRMESHSDILEIYHLYTCRLQPVNLFGGRIVSDDEDAEQEEIEFVPARVDDTEEKYGRILFLSLSSYDEGNENPSDDDEVTIENFNNSPFMNPLSVSALEAGEKDKESEYYDRIYIGWYDGTNYYQGSHLPYPNVDNIVIADDWSEFSFAHFSLRINDRKSARSKTVYKINAKSKTTFKFISDTIPDVRAVFHINGRRYLCEKITATISDDGMSQLMKGEFWPLAD